MTGYSIPVRQGVPALSDTYILISPSRPRYFRFRVSLRRYRRLMVTVQTAIAAIPAYQITRSRCSREKLPADFLSDIAAGFPGKAQLSVRVTDAFKSVEEYVTLFLLHYILVNALTLPYFGKCF